MDYEVEGVRHTGRPGLRLWRKTVRLTTKQ